MDKWVSLINDEQVRNNAESIIVAVAAIAFVIITKGFISGFSFDLFLSLEPYASGIGVGVAKSIIQNNMISRGMPDEISANDDLKKVMEDVSKLDVQITDYEYAEDFLEGYNKNEYARLQKIATDKETRQLKYRISIKKSLGRKYKKLQRRLDYITEYGSKVNKYTPVTLQDLLSFNSTNELVGKDRINFSPIKHQRKGMIKSNIMVFLASGIMAGLPLVAGENQKELLIFLAFWLPMLGLTALKTYTKTRKVTSTTYLKTLQVKKNVLILCLDNFKNWSPVKDEPIKKDDVVEVLEIDKPQVKSDFEEYKDKAMKDTEFAKAYNELEESQDIWGVKE